MKAIGNPLFSDKSLDRATKVRESASEIRQTLQLPKTKHTLIWRGKLLFDFSDRKPKIGYLKKIDKFWAEFPHTNFSQGNFLGYSDKAPIFYHDISSWEDPNKDLSKLNSFLDESEQSHPSLPENYFFS